MDPRFRGDDDAAVHGVRRSGCGHPMCDPRSDLRCVGPSRRGGLRWGTGFAAPSRPSRGLAIGLEIAGWVAGFVIKERGFALLWLRRATAHPGMPVQAMRIGASAHRRIGAPAHRRTGAPAHWHTGAPAHRPAVALPVRPGVVRRLRRGHRYDEKWVIMRKIINK